MLTSYRDLKVWQRGIELIIEIYRLTKPFPKDELFALVSQMRRAAVSIVSNIAEGYARKSRQEYIRFLRIAFASGAELETQLIVAQKLQFASQKEYEKAEQLLTEVLRMLNTLIVTLNPKP